MYEDLSLRTLNTKHYVNGDGSYSAKIYGGLVHYKDENNQLQDIELNIIPEVNWEFEYALKKNTFRAYFNDSTDINNYTLAGWEIVNSQGVSRWINYKLYGAAPINCSYVSNKFKYYEVFPEVDLEYIVTPEKLKENIIVKSLVENLNYTFTLKLDGVRLEQQVSGDIFFIDITTNEVLWKIEKPYASDANGLKTYNVNYTLGKQIYNSVEYDSITVEIADNNFLASAVYPIIIDPTTTIDYNATGNKDSEISSYTPDANEGSDASAIVGNPYTTSGRYRRALFYFDLSNASIPTNAIVSSAIMHLYAQNGMTHDNKIIRAYKLTSSWTEIGVTWNNQPTYDSSVNIATTVGAYFNYYDWDIAQFVQAWVNTPVSNYGVILIKDNEGEIESNKDFSCKERTDTTQRPMLTITYTTNTAPETPVITSPIAGNSYDNLINITTNTVTDADGNNITFKIYLSDDGTNYSLVRTSDSVASGSSLDATIDISAKAETTNAKLYVTVTDSNGAISTSDVITFTISHGKVYAKVGGVYVKCKVYQKVSGVYQLVSLYWKSGTYQKL